MKHSSEGQSILPKVVLSRALFFCVGTTPLRLVPSISLYYVHLLLNIGINRTFTQIAEVLCDLLKLVKSDLVTYHMVYPFVSQEHSVKTF